MHTGSRDTVGVIDRINGMDNRHIWDDERCDKIEGADSNIYIFSPHLIQDRNKILYVYSKEMCRKIPFHFAEQVTIYNIPSLR